ncbi:MAG: ABC transporter ATP-binding protein [Candidatus Izemoplasmatales bacterium]|nr:ABC transporter ATP-binding protein [Candidatus Izemoplasmatales bacterium]
MEKIVEFRNISIDYELKRAPLHAVKDVTLPIIRGKITALVGESGSGKTTLASSLLEVISAPGRVVSGDIMYYGQKSPINVTLLNEQALNRFRWKEISMVFQGAQSALNPIQTIRDHFRETYFVHHPKMKKQDAFARADRKAIELLTFVNLDSERILPMYPHELSGGMKQRVMIAFCLLLDPKVIILDEPTTALDVIVQGYIFKILKRINVELGISMLLLTHDIGVVAKFADYVGVMYGGRLMEYGTTREVFKEKLHPYSTGLIQSTPSLMVPIKDMKPIHGSPPDIYNLPHGCIFHPRCPHVMPICKESEPRDYQLGQHMVKCFLRAGDES